MTQPEFSALLAQYQLAVAALALVLFGVFFNWAFEWAQASRKFQDYTWGFVAVGVSVIIGASGFVIGWHNAAKLMVLALGAGLPMVVGAILRAERRHQAADAASQAAKQRIVEETRLAGQAQTTRDAGQATRLTD